jgi:hypothetical protein
VVLQNLLLQLLDNLTVMKTTKFLNLNRGATLLIGVVVMVALWFAAISTLIHSKSNLLAGWSTWSSVRGVDVTPGDPPPSDPFENG